jgi:hypothetical protein
MRTGFPEQTISCLPGAGGHPRKRSARRSLDDQDPADDDYTA